MAEKITRGEAIERVNSDLINTAEHDLKFLSSIIRNGWQCLDELSNTEIEEIYLEQFNEKIKIET